MKRALAFGAAALALAACSRPAPPPEPPRAVLAQVVSAGAAGTRDVYSGEVRARHEADLGFRVPGKLVARLVDAGARVKRGQALARLDPQDAKLAEQSARAQLAQAESDHTLARAELDRHADLLAKKFISASAFDAKQAAYNAAIARFDQARAQAALSANQSAYTTLAADADGVVVTVAADPGQVLAAGQPVLRLAHDGEKEVVINAPEGQVARFRPGDAVAISLWAEPGKPFRGRVREVAGGADPATRTYAVRVTAIDAPAATQLGMTANVAFPPGAQPALVVLPLGALAKQGEQPVVWTVDAATKQVRARPVKLGPYREDGVAIAEGLAGGELVVVAGAHKLRAGETVRVLDAAAGAERR